MLTPDEIENIYRTALDAGLASPQRRSLLLAWIPQSATANLPMRASPGEQLRSDLNELNTLESKGIEALSVWLSNAARLTDYLPGPPQTFTSLRETIEQRRAGQPTAKTSTQGNAADDAAPTIRVLFMSASPRATEALQVGRELTKIQARLQHEDRLSMSPVQMAADPLRLNEIISDDDATVLHYSGHGLKDGALMMENAQGLPHEVSAANFVRVLRLANSRRDKALQVRLVVLNACYSSQLAAALVARPSTVEAAIGTTKAVHDEAAIIFADGLYRALASGGDLQYAFDSAVLQVGLLEPPYSAYESCFELHCAPGTDPKSTYILPR